MRPMASIGQTSGCCAKIQELTSVMNFREILTGYQARNGGLVCMRKHCVPRQACQTERGMQHHESMPIHGNLHPQRVPRINQNRPRDSSKCTRSRPEMQHFGLAVHARLSKPQNINIRTTIPNPQIRNDNPRPYTLKSRP